MTSSEDEDDELESECEREDSIEDPSQPSQVLPPARRLSRSAKRRKIIHSSEDDNSIEDFIDDDGYGRSARGKEISSSPIEENSMNEFEEDSKQKKKSKHKIHIPKDHSLPTTTIQYGTQARDNLDSSPYRSRGARWKLPKIDGRSAHLPEPPRWKQTMHENILDSHRNNALTPSPEPLRRPVSKPTESRQITGPVKPAKDNFARSLGAFQGPLDMDIEQELADLPSDAFSSSPDSVVFTEDHPINPISQQQKRLAAPRTGLRQTTLFGGPATGKESTPSQANKVRNYRVDIALEAPTHHILDYEAIKTWVYPTNLGTIRDYQFNIVRQGLFNNMLVALPTGLGKTFIAATIMLNYFRWTKDAKIVFMAPTKPLVAQQVDACFNIAGISRSATTMLTGEISPTVRAEEWDEKRVFFMTPQTLDNDLRTGIADPRKIGLLVVDEAHRATGNYSYVKVVSFMRRFSSSFRVLALTATPGSTVESVQEVIDGLEISKVEIRTEESMDIQQFTHRRSMEEIVLDPSDEIVMLKGLLSKALQPLVDQLCSQNAYWNKDPMTLTPFGLMQAQKNWYKSEVGRRANQGLKGMMMSLFSILASVAHGIKLLNFHGIGPFYSRMKEFRSSIEEKGSKGSKYRKQINDSPHFNQLMEKMQLWINKGDFVGHPKLTFLCDTILNHFLDAGDGRLPDGAPPSNTRVIVFSEYRESAEEICRVLNRHGPLVRASVFVGQADSKGSEGMKQKQQLETIRKFKTGAFNVIVATSIGEEGLDIGQVDLIVCYDASSSPIRMLQRMGRTGRKRAGKVVLLLMRGKEEENFAKSKHNYETMQKKIASGAEFAYRHDLSTRIIPKDIFPVVDKRHIDIPPENTQDPSLPEPNRRASKAKKKRLKKFNMPDGVETGFRKASKLVSHVEDEEESESEIFETSPEQLRQIPELSSVLLSPEEVRDLEHSYQNVSGNDRQEVSMPEMTCYPECQRSLGPSSLVRHGQATERFVRMVNAMRNKTDSDVEQWQHLYEDEGPIDAYQHARSQSPAHSIVPSVSSSFKVDERLERSENNYGRRMPEPARIQRKRSVRSMSGSQSDTLHDSDNDEELEDYIDRDPKSLYRRKSASTRPSSPPNLPSPKWKPFFEPTNFAPTQETNDDDDAMPDIGELLHGRSTQHVPSPAPVRKHLEADSGAGRGRRGRRRWIVEDEDESDE